MTNNIDSMFSVDRNDVTYRLWTRESNGIFRPLYLGHLHDQDAYYKIKKNFKLIIHGWTDDADSGWYKDITTAYLKKEDLNVIAIDWSKPASALYPLSVKYTKDIGQYLGELLVDLHETVGVPYENMHLIGHSLGAHISGFAGQYVLENKKTNIGRITGLDPAGPLFLLSSEDNRLSPGDATFVDVIHTDSGKFGLSKAVGHIDFYPNGGSAPQPGCFLFSGIIDAGNVYLYIFFLIY